MKKIFLLFLMFCLANLAAQEFTIAVIPDTQCYTDYKAQSILLYPLNQIDFFYKQVNFIKEKSIVNGGPIVFAIHLGDFVERRSSTIIEWEMADRAISILDNVIPIGVVPGNHDYDRSFTVDNKKTYQIDGNKYFSKYFGPNSKHFKDKEWYGGSYHDGMDSWEIISVADKQFLFLGLEVEPSDEVLEWAQSIINAHANLPVILVTHEYISFYQDKINKKNNAFIDNKCRLYMDRNTPEELWNKFVKKNSQIVLILCGHCFFEDRGEGLRIDVNDDGYEVPAILSNYQGRKEIINKIDYKYKKYPSGDGWLRLLEFNLSENLINIKTYSPVLDKYEIDDDSCYEIKFNYNWLERFN